MEHGLRIGGNRLPLRARLMALLLAALGLVAIPAGSAAAAVTVKISGGGFGHGLGMSQYGAYGQAVAGRSAEQILTHYYSGTQVAAADVSHVRVGLLQGEDTLSLSSSAGDRGTGLIRFKVAGDTKTVAEGEAGVEWRLAPNSAGGVALYKNGDKVAGRLGGPGEPVLVKYSRFGSSVSIAEKGRSYSYGQVEISASAGSTCPSGYCLRAVVELTMQKYLYGLGEVPASWPVEALKAQVVAARTYVHRKQLSTGNHRSGCDCSILDSALEQVYLGDTRRVQSGSYWLRWTTAVDDTSGLVVLYKGQPINAMYTASSGGHTENNENIWPGSALPYLRGVSDPWDATAANPYHKWTVKMTWSQFSSRLDAAFGTGDLVTFEILEPRGVSGRVAPATSNGGGVRIKGSDDTVRVSGTAVKSALGLRDTLFDVSYIN